jgi:hypothetical protein
MHFCGIPIDKGCKATLEMEHHSTLSKSKASEGSRRAYFMCPCAICSPKPIDPLAPRKSGNAESSNCIFSEPPAGALPPPPTVEHVSKEVTAGQTVKVLQQV